MSVRRPVFARCYSHLSRWMEHAGMAEHRLALVGGLAGTVLEVGAGNGLNFAHYPDTVTRVVAVEPEPHLRDRARAAAAVAPVPVEVVGGVAERLPIREGAVDAVVVSLVLCSVPDQDEALREIRRVLAAGGHLRFLEHVRADTPALIRVQRVLDATVWPRLAGGCHTGRDTAAAIERSGFRVERLDRFHFPGAVTPFSSHIAGVAARAGD